MSCGHAENAITISISARNATREPGCDTGSSHDRAPSGVQGMCIKRFNGLGVAGFVKPSSDRPAARLSAQLSWCSDTPSSAYRGLSQAAIRVSCAPPEVSSTRVRMGWRRLVTSVSPTLKRFAKALDHPAPWKDESLLRRPEKEDSPSRRRGHGQKRGGANLGGQPLFDQTLRRYAHQGRSLTPKKPPGLRPKIDEQGKRLLQADLKERPAATLPQRREFLQRMAGECELATRRSPGQ